MSVIRVRLLAELDLRVRAFSHAIELLEASVAADEGGFRIHTTQVGALRIMMDELCRCQREFLTRLAEDVSDAEFADGVAALVFEQMTGAERIWNLFADAFAARRAPDLAPHLDTADLVAAECYLLCVGRARSFGAIDEDSLREPPLVCPQAFPEPIALGRRERFGALGTLCDAGWRFHDLVLPIPLVLLPPDQIACVWLLSVLCHEVGHDVDKDLALTPEIAMRIAEMGAIAPERRGAWRRWSAEILADGFGVLLGGAGFAQAITSLLLVLAPGERFRALDPGATHPHPLIRVPLVAAMARRLGVLGPAAGLAEEPSAGPVAPEIAPFLGDVDAIAAAVIEGELSALRGHALAELNPDLASDPKKTERLATFLSCGELRPSPDKPSPFPYRLVPSAAQLAVAATSPDPAALDAVQQRAAAFAAAIPRPPFLDGGARITPRRAASIARMARRIDFRTGGPP